MRYAKSPSPIARLASTKRGMGLENRLDMAIDIPIASVTIASVTMLMIRTEFCKEWYMDERLNVIRTYPTPIVLNCTGLTKETRLTLVPEGSCHCHSMVRADSSRPTESLPVSDVLFSGGAIPD